MALNQEQKTSFDKAEYITVSCANCDDRLTIDGDSFGCYHDKEEAIDACEMNDWKVEGDIATCDLCTYLLSAGIAKYFTGTEHAFKGKVTVVSVDIEDNKLNVICTKDGHSWDEEFDLQHTIWGFEQGEYKAVEG